MAPAVIEGIQIAEGMIESDGHWGLSRPSPFQPRRATYGGSGEHPRLIRERHGDQSGDIPEDLQRTESGDSDHPGQIDDTGGQSTWLSVRGVPGQYGRPGGVYDFVFLAFTGRLGAFFRIEGRSGISCSDRPDSGPTDPALFLRGTLSRCVDEGFQPGLSRQCAAGRHTLPIGKASCRCRSSDRVAQLSRLL
jgi:hypothetical protein